MKWATGDGLRATARNYLAPLPTFVPREASPGTMDN